MSLNRRIVSGSLMVMLALGGARGLALLTLPWMTRLFAPDAYGAAALATTFMSLLSVIALMGMDLSYTRSCLGEQNGLARSIEAYAWRFAFFSGVFAAIVGMTTWWMWGRQAPSAAVWIGGGVLLYVLLAMAQARSRIYGDYRRLSVAVAAGSAFTVAAQLAAGWLSWRSGVALVAGTVAGVAISVLMLGWPPSLSSKHQLLPDAIQRRKILVIGLPAVVTAPMYWLITSSDRWFLVHFVSNAEAGVYAVAATIGSVGALLNTAVTAVWMPEAIRLHEARGVAEAAALGQVMSRIVLTMALGWLLTAGLASEAVHLLTSQSFHAAIAYVPWLAGAVFFVGVYQIASTGLVLDRQLGPTALIWLAGAITSALLSFVFVPTFGAMASARIQCLCMAAIAISVIPFARARHPIPLPSSRLLGALTITVVAGVATSAAWHPQAFVSLSLKLPCLAALALAILWVGDPGLIRRLRSRRLWTGLK